MTPGKPMFLKAVLDPKPPVTEMIAPPVAPPDHGAGTDGFSLATQTTGGTRRKLPFWFKIVALMFLGGIVLSLLSQAAAIFYSLIQI